MRIPRPPHNWSVPPEQAVAIQMKLASAVRQVRPSGPLRYIAGVDAAFSPQEEWCLAGWCCGIELLARWSSPIPPPGT